jgi:hypothetical protein
VKRNEQTIGKQDRQSSDLYQIPDKHGKAHTQRRVAVKKSI